MMDPHYSRVRYVRYADDFIISVIGPHSLAQKIKRELGLFLKGNLNLRLNEGKTLLTSASSGKAYFLGTYIQWKNHIDKKVVLAKTGVKTRITARIKLTAP